MPSKKRKWPAEDDAESTKGYAALKPRIHHVSQSIIRKKWSTLPESSQGKVMELLRAGERPAIMIHRDEKRRLEAQQAVSEVQRKFSKRVPKIPFPPGTKDSHFDYEALLGSNRVSETQLTSTIHYNQLLRDEIKRRRALLATEKMELHRVDSNAKAEDTLRKRQQRKVHPLLRDSELANEESAKCPQNLTMKATVALHDDEDTMLQRLTQRLVSHLESMQNNSAQVEKLKAVLPRSRALLEDLVA